MPTRILRLAPLLLSLGLALPAAGAEVTLQRCPEGGIQPKLLAAGDGSLHLISFHGDPRAGDIRYRHRPAGAAWGEAVQVNSQPGSVVAIGTVRSPDLALGVEDRVHVAWMGAEGAQPRGPDGKAPMLYAYRLADGTFTTQRCVASRAGGLDAGGAVAADGAGQVWVLWHGAGAEEGEIHRRVYAARSGDGGASFAVETPVDPEQRGACACCGISVAATGPAEVAILYRGAEDGGKQRDLQLLMGDPSAAVAVRRISNWQINGCPMSTSTIANDAAGTLLAWQERDQVFWAPLQAATDGTGEPIPAPATGKGRKHPAIARDAAGTICLVWTEGTGWNKGGSVCWQLFGADGRPISGSAGRKADLPAWSRPTVVADAKGFLILY